MYDLFFNNYTNYYRKFSSEQLWSRSIEFVFVIDMAMGLFENRSYI